MTFYTPFWILENAIIRISEIYVNLLMPVFQRIYLLAWVYLRCSASQKSLLAALSIEYSLHKPGFIFEI